MRLSDFIRQQSRSILAGHRAELPGAEANGGSCRERWGYLGEILLAAADHLSASEACGARAPIADHRSFDQAPSVVREWARRHAAARQAQDHTLNQVVAELHALRASVARAWKPHLDADAAAAVGQLVDFGEAIDQALSAAVGCYESRLREAAREQSELHERLVQSEQRFRALVNASSHVVYRLSPDGAEMRELDGRGTVLDTTRPSTSWLDEYIHPDDQPKAVRAFQEAFRNRSLYQVEHRYRRVNGKLGWTLSRAVPVIDDQGRITEWFGAATDVTASKQVEETLREADRRKEEFLVMLGHELRNPLAPLRTCVDLLDQARCKPELLRALRAMMDRQLTHLMRLVDDLLDISRITRGDIQLQQIPLDLNTPIEAAIEQARAAITERRHALHVELSSAALPIQGDSVRLTQVVTNLLNNAAKYMEPGGTIHVASAMEDGKAVVRVRDTGYGIAAGQFDKLFKLFSQIDEHRTQSGGAGLGVGLALSRQLVTLHGGTIEARSEGPGRGSEFIVRLELASDHPHLGAEEEE